VTGNALIAAVISFVALTWFGHEMGMGAVAPLMPLAIDGFAVACSVGVVRSQSSGEPARKRISEWVGLFLALSLSIAGNVQHALVQGNPSAPRLMVIAYGAAIPIIVAYGIHVYGRAMANGISAHVLVDDRTKIQFGLAHLGENQSAPKTASAPTHRAQEQRIAPHSAAQPRRTAPAAPAQVSQPSAPAAAQRTDRERVSQRIHELRSEGAEVNASALHRELGLAHDVSTTKRWVKRLTADADAAPRLSSVQN